MNKNFLPRKLYRKVADLAPICWVDLVIKKGNQFLLVKRLEQPVKGKWWFIGGRVFLGETLIRAAKRKLKEEINIKSFQEIKFLGVKELSFKKGICNRPIYGIANVFLVQLKEKDCQNIRVDKTSAGYKWFKKIGRGFSPYLKQFLKLSGFK